MKTSLKIIFILIIFILLFMPSIKSFGINMNLISNIIEDNTINDDYADSYTNDIDVIDDTDDMDDTNTSTTYNSNSISNPSNTSPKTVTVTSTNNNEFLTVENILCIILIVIGILLVFLGIAIIIRFK